MLGALVIAGCLVAVVLDLVGAGLSDRVGMISDTISNLAAAEGANTPVDELADTGLYAFVIAVLATTWGLLRWRIERLDWKIGAFLLVVVAICVALIAGYEAYTSGEGPVIHYKLVYVLGGAFPLTVLLTAGQFYRIDSRLGIALYALGAIWAVAAPFLFVVPTAWDGAYERLLAALMLGWFLAMGAMIWRDPDTHRHIPKDERS
ncbi:MAG: DUF998 domain-containing protein [Erythrobacter sp.]|uniref:DUF998 domain-containing protein n=1 Tax=Erythrobacter sp. TaxID=1042 RepID=UPI0032ECB41A